MLLFSIIAPLTVLDLTTKSPKLLIAAQGCRSRVDALSRSDQSVTKTQLSLLRFDAVILETISLVQSKYAKVIVIVLLSSLCDGTMYTFRISLRHMPPLEA